MPEVTPNLPTTSAELARVALAELAPEFLARVVDVAGDDGDAIRLKSLGICVGRRVQLVKSGDPLIVRVLGARVGLSARLAACVSVEPLSSSGEP